LNLNYPHYEILVVDNTPGNSDIAQTTSNTAVRYIRERRPGLNWGRNRGIEQARHDIIAFTTDNTRVDSHWLRAIANAFHKTRAMAMTGLVAPAELETEAQVCFEHNYGMGRGIRWQTLRRGRLTNSDLLWANGFGSGANMAFRRELFSEIGPFDEALGTGTPVGGGGDIEFLQRLVMRGHTLLYEPSALVWQYHPRDAASLSRLVHNRGRSLGARLLSFAQNRTVRRSSILHFMAREWPGWWTLRHLYRSGKCPRRVILAELAGALVSPWSYWAAQRRAQQIGRTTTPVVIPGSAPGSV
jgi:GT2 family glycosyltransferase